MPEPRKTIIAGCLFIAHETTDTDPIFQERKISYHERSILASVTDKNVLRVFVALEQILHVQRHQSFHVGGGRREHR